MSHNFSELLMSSNNFRSMILLNFTEIYANRYLNVKYIFLLFTENNICLYYVERCRGSVVNGRVTLTLSHLKLYYVAGLLK